MLRIIFGFLLVFISLRTFAGEGGVVFEQSIEKTSVNQEKFASFVSIDPNREYYLSVTPRDNKCSSIIVKINGNSVYSAHYPRFLKQHLIKLSLLPTNKIEVIANGPISTKAVVRILDPSLFQVQFGPEILTKGKGNVTKSERKFTSSDPNSMHILVVEGNGSSTKNKSLVNIKMNGKSILSPLEMIFDRKNKIYKLIEVVKENKLSIEQFGLVGSSLKISIISPDDIGETPSPGILTLTQHSGKAFNKYDADARFILNRATFNTSKSTVSIFVNNVLLLDSQYSISSNQIIIPRALSSDKTDIEIIAFDSDGGVISWRQGPLWVGKYNVVVQVRDLGNPVAGATVEATLGDDDEVAVKGTTDSNGNFLIKNVPERSISFLVRYKDKAATIIDMVKEDQEMFIDLQQPLQVSSIQNNDFSLGLDGWTTSSGPSAEIVPHREEGFDWDEYYRGSVSGVKAASKATVSQKSIYNSKMTLEQKKQYRKNLGNTSSQEISKNSVTITNKSVSALVVPDLDLRISTRASMSPGELSRAFRTEVGSTNIKVRYRFITREVPGGFYGSEFNDGYSLIVKKSSGVSTIVRGNMNAMGLSRFDSSGAASWEEIDFPVSAQGDVVEITGSVRNVGDNQFDSALEIDYVEENKFAIINAGVSDIDNSPLSFISLSSANPAFSGNTRINGSLVIAGDPGDSVSSIELRVMNGSTLVAKGDIVSSRLADIASQFVAGQNKTLATGHLYNIPNSQVYSSYPAVSTSLSLKVIAYSTKGKKAEFVIKKPVTMLPNLQSRSTAERFSFRDDSKGGDDWGTPECLATARNLINKFSNIRFVVNDISNMNGGSFEPDHTSHQVGSDFDFRFLNSSNVDRAVAEQLLTILKADSNIEMMGVQYNPIDGDPFFDAIKDEVVNGRKVINIIKNWSKHDDHFHYRCKK